MDASQVFRDRFGRNPDVMAVAPGRVNLIGEHTDYSGGFVVPSAIDKAVTIAAGRTNGWTTVFSTALGDGQSFDSSNVTPGEMDGWATYVAGMAWALGIERKIRLPNIDAVVSSDLPIGSGLSSSAALELAAGAVWNQLCHLNFSNLELAMLAQKCENEFISVQCGLMDQVACAMGRAGHVMFIDMTSLEIRYLPVPDSIRIVVCDTGVRRSLPNSAYNERRQQCVAAAAAVGAESLRDVTIGRLNDFRSRMHSDLFERATHVVSENGRCQEFVEAVDKLDWERAGQLMFESHRSLRDLYEVSSIELDEMVASARTSRGCIGAKMTGAGFGGCCVALVQGSELANFIEDSSKTYEQMAGLVGSIFACDLSNGVQAVEN